MTVLAEEKQPHYSGEDTWSMTFEDDFNTLNEEIWSVRGSDYRDYHDVDCTEVSEGHLNLYIKEKNGKVVLGRVDTNIEDYSNTFAQKYGFFECRAKIPPTDGTYFAFWMSNYPGVAQVGNGGRDGAEIDVVETAYASSHTMHTVHWDGYGVHHKSASAGKVSTPNIHDGDYHIFGLEWDENSLKYYVDGVHKWTYSGEGVPRVEEFLILSSGMGNWVEGNISNATLPYKAQVDWVRVYEKDIVEGPINPGFETGNVDGWDINGSAQVTSEQAYSGEYSARLTSNGWFEQTLYGLEPNTDYTYKVMVNTSAKAKFCIKDFGSNQIVSAVESTEGEFVEHSINFTTGSTNTSARMCFYHWKSGAGVSYADDFSIIKLD